MSWRSAEELTLQEETDCPWTKKTRAEVRGRKPAGDEGKQDFSQPENGTTNNRVSGNTQEEARKFLNSWTNNRINALGNQGK